MDWILGLTQIVDGILSGGLQTLWTFARWPIMLGLVLALALGLRHTVLRLKGRARDGT
ncbi:MAG: hypothetical protein OXT09_22665 [Myxococcales bacterium]|nr:hypothetical protein [Myxococcales bacterium]